MDAFAPLYARYGDRLTLVRDRNWVSWEFDGQVVVAEMGAPGVVEASFADRPARDGAAQPCVALYRPGRDAYVMSPAGSERLAQDVADFFAGIREPRFTFSAWLDDPT